MYLNFPLMYMLQPGDFFGKSALQEIKKEGLKKKLVFMKVNTEGHDVDPEGNETIWSDGKVRHLLPPFIGCRIL